METTKPDEQCTLMERCCPNPNRYYWLNLTGITLASVCLMTSYAVIFYVQSSLYSQAGLGTIALSVNYASQMGISFFLPPFLMRTIGCKWTMVLSAIFIDVFIVANLHGSFATLIPASVFLGIGFATMSATMNTVVSDLAMGYAKLTVTSVAAKLSRFFVIFYTFLHTGSIWGSIISAKILSPKVTTGNITRQELTCGAQFCSSDIQLTNNLTNIAASSQVPQLEVNNLVIAGLSISAVGIILLLTLLASFKLHVSECTESSLSRLLSTIRLHRNSNLLLLIVCTMNSGLMFSFFSADFTEAFVTCSIGIHNVGLVTTSFAIVLCGGTALQYVLSFIPRPALFLATVCLNIADLLLMLFWVPNPESPYVFYIIAGIWGGATSVWISQLLALYGEVFPQNHKEAYSAYRIWFCLGFFIGYSWSFNLCMDVKIYIILGFIVTGTVSYLALENRISKSKLEH